jgi:hypothetical protein
VVCFRAFSFFILSHTFWSSTLRAACSPGCKVDHLDYPQFALQMIVNNTSKYTYIKLT